MGVVYSRLLHRAISYLYDAVLLRTLSDLEQIALYIHFIISGELMYSCTGGKVLWTKWVVYTMCLHYYGITLNHGNKDVGLLFLEWSQIL